MNRRLFCGMLGKIGATLVATPVLANLFPKVTTRPDWDEIFKAQKNKKQWVFFDFGSSNWCEFIDAQDYKSLERYDFVTHFEFDYDSARDFGPDTPHAVREDVLKEIPSLKRRHNEIRRLDH